jgi:hypothetical protein
MSDPYLPLNRRFSLQNLNERNSSKTIAELDETMAKNKTNYFNSGVEHW